MAGCILFRRCDRIVQNLILTETIGVKVAVSKAYMRESSAQWIGGAVRPCEMLIQGSALFNTCDLWQSSEKDCHIEWIT